jgi:soluble lytic murein transglycosylase-like protein
MSASAPTRAHPSAAVLLTARDTVKAFVTTAHHTVMILGITAIIAIALMFVKPDLADHLKALSPFSAAIAQALPATVAAQPVTTVAALAPTAVSTVAATEVKPAHVVAKLEPEQLRVTSWLSKKYRVSSDATNMLVSTAFTTAREIRIDPLLVLAVMAIESGLNPFAESPVGAQGLMQVMAKIHHEKFHSLGGVKAALNPAANIRVGSLILKDYVTRGGSVEAGLKMYVGAAAFDNDAGYGSKVMAEYRRLKDVALGRKVPEMSTVSVPKPQPKAPVINNIVISQDDKVAAL